MSEFEHSMRAFVRVAKCLSQVFGNEFSLQLQRSVPARDSLQEKRRSLRVPGPYYLLLPLPLLFALAPTS